MNATKKGLLVIERMLGCSRFEDECAQYNQQADERYHHRAPPWGRPFIMPLTPLLAYDMTMLFAVLNVPAVHDVCPPPTLNEEAVSGHPFGPFEAHEETLWPS